MNGARQAAAEAQLIARYHSLRKCVTCPICLDLFREPHALATCQHSFCRTCITSALASKHVCPVCSQPVETAQPISIQRFNEGLDLYRKIVTMLERILDSKDNQAAAEPAPAPIVAAPIAEAAGEMNVDPVYPDPSPPCLLINNQNNAQAKDEMEVDHAPPIIPQLLFSVDDLVNVLPRTWANINKLGGVGRVEDSKLTGRDPPHDILYRVKYVLDGRVDDEIPSVFVEPFVELQRGRRRGRQSSPSNPARSLFTDEGEDGDRGGTHGSSSKRGRHSFPPSQQSTKSSSVGTSNKSPATTTLSRRNLDQLLAGSDSKSKQQSSSHVENDNKENNVNGSSSSAVASASTSQPNPASSSHASSSHSLIKHAPPFVILTTALNDSVSSQVTKALDSLCLLYPETVIVEHAFTNTVSNLPVTHLVVSTDKHGLVSQRTMKLLRALAAGLWIVSDRWLLQSAKGGRIIEEAAYEVKGCSKGDVSLPYAPRRARLAHMSSGDRKAFPLHGQCVLLDGPFPLPGPARSDLEALVTGLGGMVYTSRHPFFIAAAGRKTIAIRSNITPVIAQPPTASQLEEDSQQVKDEGEQQLRRSKIPIVSVLWLLDCVTNFAWQPTDSFLL